MNDGQRPDRQRRAGNFEVHIPDSGEGPEEYPDTVISSYSDPAEAQRRSATPAGARADRRAKLAHSLRSKEKSRKNRQFFRLMWLSMVVMVSVLLAKYAISGINDMLATNRQNVSATVEIPKNASSDQVAQILYRSGVIRDVDFFRLYAYLTKAPKTYDGGSYQITTGMDYLALINSIQSTENRVDTVKLTFPEGVNALEIADKLEKNGVCTAKEAIAVMNGMQLDDSFSMLQDIQNSSERYYRLEGYLFPDTYEFFKNEKPEQAIQKMISNCNSKLTKQIRDKASEEGMTADQLLTLASMIQSEAADKDDMYKVSSVFHNRLASKKSELHHLDSDPTTYYPYRTQALVPANIRGTYKSRYDTYTVEGLPPGPICSPGAEAIDAALNPASTSYYYFCHDKNGKAYYASTAAQHQANLKKAGLR